MRFNWTVNIRCRIIYGRAFLIQDDMKKCNGLCADCTSFLGVNISQIGEESLDGSCNNRM